MTKKYLFLIVALLVSLLSQAQPIEEIQKLLASDGGMNDKFGYSVSISGDYAIVGARNNSVMGSAYIYNNNSGFWQEVIKLIPSNGSADDSFGFSVCISGDYAIIGAPGDNENGNYSGAAYVFYKHFGVWQQLAKLTPSDGAEDDHFGSSVSISGDYAIVGAWGDADNGVQSGSAYIFINNSNIWQQQSKIISSDGAEDDFFGSSVSISGDYAIVGAYGDDVYGDKSGSAYICYNTSGNWLQIRKLTASDGVAEDRFGTSVNISGNNIIVGAPYNLSNGTRSGSAYIFVKKFGLWQLKEKIAPLNGDNGDWFGCSVSISDNYSVVGAYYDSDNGSFSGAAYVFYYNSSTWQNISKITPSGAASDDYFGNSVCFADDYAIIGSFGDSDNGNSSGSAYIFGTPLPNIISHPNNQLNVCLNSNVYFSINAEYVSNYQWQHSTDNGISFTDISNGGPYSGTQTDTLVVEVIPTVNYYQFRCVVSNISGSDSTTNAFLIIDNEDPEITCTNDEERYANETHQYIVNGTEFDPVEVDDNCGISSVINNYNQTSTLEGEHLPEGQILILWTVEDNVGNQANCSFTVTINSYDGVEDLQRAGISIFPSPTNGKIHFEFGNNKIQKLRIYDITGKIIIDKTEVQQNEIIELSFFETGVYIIRIQTNQEILTTKILKK